MQSYVVGKKIDFDHAILVLPGRGVPCNVMHHLMHVAGLCEENILLHLEPHELIWYPAPNGPTDQHDAINGLKHSSGIVVEMLHRFMKKFEIPQEKLSVVGYSAGAVVALETSVNFNFTNVVSLSGAIFEPEKVPPCANDSKYHIQHDYFDDVFDWDERYLPMKKALIDNNYRAFFTETHSYGHDSFNQEVIELLGYIFAKNV